MLEPSGGPAEVRRSLPSAGLNAATLVTVLLGGGVGLRGEVPGVLVHPPEPPSVHSPHDIRPGTRGHEGHIGVSRTPVHVGHTRTLPASCRAAPPRWGC